MAQRHTSGTFSKTAGSRAGVGLEHASRNPNASGRRRVARAVGGGRHPVRPAEARCERPDAAQPDGEADVRDAAVGVPKQRSSALEPAGEEVLVRRLTEGAAELAGEVRGREACGACECGHVERVAVAGVDQVLGTEQMAGRRDGRDHPVKYHGHRQPRSQSRNEGIRLVESRMPLVSARRRSPAAGSFRQMGG